MLINIKVNTLMHVAQVVPILIAAFLLTQSAHAGPVKTATVEDLLQREFIGAVLMDERGYAYFERVDAIATSPVRFPYPTGRMYKKALKKIYTVPLDGSGEATPLFEQDDSTGYYFASDNPWSPNKRYVVIYRFRDAQAQPGVVDVQKRTAKFFDVSAHYSARASLEWVSDHEFVIASAENIANIYTYRINGVLAMNEARTKGWRDGAVTADAIGAGKYAPQEEPRHGVSHVKIDIRSAEAVLVDSETDADVLAARPNVPVDLDTVDLVAASETSVFYVQDGDLWSASLGGTRENMTGAYPYEIEPHVMSDPWRDRQLSLIKPADDKRIPSLEELVFASEADGRTQYLVFSADGRSYNVISPPQQQSQLLIATQHGALFLTNSYETGSHLHHVKPGSTSEPIDLYRFNQQLAGVTPATDPIPVRHRGHDGSEVTSWLYLPPGASLKRSTPYPTVVIPYDMVYSDDGPTVEGQTVSFTLDIWLLSPSMVTAVEVFAAEGYAVLLPSIPLAGYGKPSEPMTQMIPSILSGVDAAVETGFVDPDRLAVSGNSYGGYIGLSVAVQTDRFHAIIAQSPATNWVSFYGQFKPAREIEAQQFRVLSMSEFTETAQPRMLTPPWRDTDRYIRNSPLFFANKATTPILLMHGDYDGTVMVEQSEEMFTALRREGKDAVFVRYIGEHHRNVQPQNQRDMWRRVFDFLEENGVAPTQKTVH